MACALIQILRTRNLCWPLNKNRWSNALVCTNKCGSDSPHFSHYRIIFPDCLPLFTWVVRVSKELQYMFSDRTASWQCIKLTTGQCNKCPKMPNKKTYFHQQSLVRTFASLRWSHFIYLILFTAVQSINDEHQSSIPAKMAVYTGHHGRHQSHLHERHSVVNDGKKII